MYVLDLAEALRREGLKVVERPGWKTRGSSTFSPRGTVCHHTGPWSTVEGMVRLCENGRSDLPGPLANVVLAPDGTCYVIAAGRANHAGPGGYKGLSGNTSVFGIEAIHSGSHTQPWPQAQMDAYYKLCAAMARLRGFSPDYVCSHKEWAPTRKYDPVNVDMNAFRATVGRLLGTQPAPQGVAPMYSPPLQIAASLACPTGGLWQVAPDGAVYAWAGAPFLGGANGQS